VNVATVAGVTVLAALGTIPPLYALGALVLIAMPTHAGHVLALLTGRPAPAPVVESEPVRKDIKP
jgi:hypothetical protein